LETKNGWRNGKPKTTLQTTQQHQQTGPATAKNYFQQGSKSVGGYLKEVWRFAIAGSVDKDALLENIKWTLNKENWRIIIRRMVFQGRSQRVTIL
jgi:hypothetical protein